MSEWKPIETAPKETDVLCCGLGAGRPMMVLGKFYGERLSFNDPYTPHHPTHWMPLPKEAK